MSATATIVTPLDFVSIPTRDIEAAAELYENALGLERSSAWQRPGEEPLGSSSRPARAPSP
jgi:catechol 2,3-dioxygenase-like lactoylglutathione lyase family enzyme